MKILSLLKSTLAVEIILINEEISTVNSQDKDAII